MLSEVDAAIPSQLSATLATFCGPSDLADIYRLEASHILNTAKRGELGQFFTPAPIAQFMASFIAPVPEINLLDAGAGAGALTAAVIEAALAWPQKPKCIHVTAYEIDEAAIHLLRSTLNECYQLCSAHNIEFEHKIICGDFVEKATEIASGQPTLFDRDSHRWNIAVLNPPYRKITSDSHNRLALRRVGIETSNLYAAFVWLTAKLMDSDGQIVAITPRSFCNGPYFLPFRKALLKEFQFERVHIFESRDQAFRDDDVLQENIIYKLVKGKANRDVVRDVVVSVSYGEDNDLITQRVTNHADIVRPGDAEMFIHIVPDEMGAQISQSARNLDHSLNDLGLSVSTGRVVDFRAQAALRDLPEPGKTVPLIYPQHISDGVIEWPRLSAKKPNAIVRNTETEKLLIPNSHYVLVKRFSAKEEKRRVMAAITHPEQFATECVGIENHLNYFHAKGQGLDEKIAKGLSIFLNSQLVDQYFRQFNGHTQVNAADLRKLRYPSLEQLQKMGSRAEKHLAKQDDKDGRDGIEQIILQELNIMATSLNASNPTPTHKHIEEALAILRALNLPRDQQNNRSALTLLALLGIKPDTKWSQASTPLRGITEIMDFAREHYGFRYAPNTRETFRRFTMHQFVQIGIAVANPDNPQRPTNSPKFHYQIAPEALKLFQSYGSRKWKLLLASYLITATSLQVLQAKERSMALLPVRLPNGAEVILSGGGQSPLIKQIIEVFCPRFTPDGIIVYVGDTSKKMRGDEIAYLKKLGVSVDQHGKMPDIIIHFTEKKWLVVIEAVTSHGPISIKRHNELKDLLRGSKTGLVFVTAFETRQAFAQYLREIAWETDVWIAESPSHLIHFNGERFLGPY